MTRFADFLREKQYGPSEAPLREYLSTRGEWLGLEFKEAKAEPTFGLRKTVAAFANRNGGDAFLGIQEDGVIVGTQQDAATISRILNQVGAPRRDDSLTDLVQTVREPVRIPIEGMAPVWWIDVAAHGRLVGAVKRDGTLGLYDRPGAESPEVDGFGAIDMFRRRTRARLLLQLYEESARVESQFNWVYQGPNSVRADQIAPLRRIIESSDWLDAATNDDRTLTNESYLGKFLSLAEVYAGWSERPYSEISRLCIERKNDLTTATVRLRSYLVNQRVIPA